MARGYAGKLLDVDLSKGNVKDTVFPETVLRNYLGGRGLGAKILWDRLGQRWEKVDPLGPENIFLALLGPLTALHPGARVCCTGKSPQSNGIIGSTCSGEFASELKCAGYDGVIVTGKASSPVYILVTDNKGEIRDASRVWGRDGHQTVLELTKEVRAEMDARQGRLGLQRDPGLIYIGPAGESRVRTAAAMQKWAHAAGYGGYGAVMGSKNLKAIVAKGSGPLPEVAKPLTFKAVYKEINRPENVGWGDSMKRWGTGYGGYEVGANSSSEPVRNWQEEWHDEKQFGGNRFDTKYWVKRYWSDFHCAGACLKLAVIKTGPFKGTIGDNPDYEMQAYEGPNLGIYDPGACIYMSTLMDKLGFSGINGGNTLAFAAELYQRGILTRDELGFELKWGDPKAFTALAEKIVRREGIGDVLAEGTYRAAKRISQMKGVDVMKYAVHVKGVEIGAHGTRSGQDMNPIGYAANVQGGDHTSSVYDGYDDMGMVFLDSAVVCSFVAKGDLTWRYLDAVTGWGITRDEWNKVLGRRIIAVQRAAELLGGPDVRWTTVVDDDNPPRYYEPLPTGPHAGKTTDKKVVEERKSEYYKAVGWDERGIPRSDVLKELGLEDVDKALDRVRP